MKIKWNILLKERWDVLAFIFVLNMYIITFSQLII